MSDCKAGWTELQNYRAAKAIRWLHSAENVAKLPELAYATVFWDWRGHTDASGACWWVMASQRDGFLCYPITSPNKATGVFRFKNEAHAALLRADLMLPVEPESASYARYLPSLEKSVDEWIAEYERVAAPLGTRAWRRYDAYPRAA